MKIGKFSVKQTNDIVVQQTYELLELVLGSSWLVMLAKLGGVKKWLSFFFLSPKKQSYIRVPVLVLINGFQRNKFSSFSLP